MFTASPGRTDTTEDPAALSVERTPAATNPSSGTSWQIAACTAEHPRRAEAERFIQDRFRRTHGAHVQTFMPKLLLLVDAEGVLRGVTGCRLADQEPLYLERYFSKPIEEMLASAVGATPKRADVVEVGNFACRDPRAATVFVSLLPRHLLGMGVNWVTFTATDSIRRILRHLGARCADLGAAEGACARGGADDWGRYYARHPRVMAGYLPLARRIPSLWSARHGD